jgi:hypothetical protein
MKPLCSRSSHVETPSTRAPRLSKDLRKTGTRSAQQGFQQGLCAVSPGGRRVSGVGIPLGDFAILFFGRSVPGSARVAAYGYARLKAYLATTLMTTRPSARGAPWPLHSDELGWLSEAPALNAEGPDDDDDLGHSTGLDHVPALTEIYQRREPIRAGNRSRAPGSRPRAALRLRVPAA